ncbi:MAG: AAA family ATPase [Pseudomonadota bacterium]
MLDALVDAIAGGARLVCLTGPEGAGKSTLAAEVGRKLPDDMALIRHDFWWRGTDVLSHFVMAMTGRPATGTSDEIAAALRAAIDGREGLRQVVLVADAAEGLPADSLARFVGFIADSGTNLAVSGLVVGAPGIAETLQGAQMALAPSPVFTLDLLDTEAALGLMRRQLAGQGIGPGQVEDAALDLVYRATQGNPRLMRSLLVHCMNALGSAGPNSGTLTGARMHEILSELAKGSGVLAKRLAPLPAEPAGPAEPGSAVPPNAVPPNAVPPNALPGAEHIMPGQHPAAYPAPPGPAPGPTAPGPAGPAGVAGQNWPHPGQQAPHASPQAAPHPGAPHPGAPYPRAPYPGAPYPGAQHPGAPYPGAPYPGAPYPGAQHPGAPYPGMPQPGVPHPGAPHPGADPSATPPAAEEPPLDLDHLRNVLAEVLAEDLVEESGDPSAETDPAPGHGPARHLTPGLGTGRARYPLSTTPGTPVTPDPYASPTTTPQGTSQVTRVQPGGMPAAGHPAAQLPGTHRASHPPSHPAGQSAQPHEAHGVHGAHGAPDPQTAPASALVLRAASNPAAVNPLLLTETVDAGEDTPPGPTPASPAALPRSALRLPPASGTPVPARAPVVRARRPGDELPETVEPIADYRQVVAQRARKPIVQSGHYRGRTGFLAGVLVSSVVLAGFVLLPGSQLMREIQGFDIGLLIDAVKGPDGEALSLPSPQADAEANPVSSDPISSDPVYADPAAADLASAEQVPPLLTNAKRPPPQLSVGPHAASIEPEFPERVRLAVLTPRGRVLSGPPPQARPATLTRPAITDPTLAELARSNPALAELALGDPAQVEPGRRPTVAVLVPEGETPQRIMLQLSDGTPEEQKTEIMERLFQDGYYDIKLEEVNLGEFMSELFRASLGLEDEEHKWIFNESRRSGDRVYILRDSDVPENE